MTDEGLRRLIEEATKESLNQSFTEAGRKYLEAARVSEEKGDIAAADDLYGKAATAFIQAAEKYRSSKSYKNAALNMCAAGDLYSDLAESEKAIRAYSAAAEDLLRASEEHLMWGEAAETQKATALAVIASMIYMMIGRDDLAFSASRNFASRNASKLRYPALVRMSQIPQMLEASIRNVDLETFSSAENAVVTELKAALSGSGAQDFAKYVDRGLEMARELLRGKIKVPKLVTRLDLPVDYTFKETVPLTVEISNAGSGDASAINIEWLVDQGLSLVSGDMRKTIPALRAGDHVRLELRVRATQQNLVGERDYEVLVKGTYSDMLRTEYSLQAGPGRLVLRDFKMTEKLLHDADVSDSRIGLLSSTLESSPFEKDVLRRLISALASSLVTARDEVARKELEGARTRISVVNQLVDAIDATLGDDSLAASVQGRREAEKRAFAFSVIEPVLGGLRQYLTEQERTLAELSRSSLAEWDRDAERRRSLGNALREASSEISALTRDLHSLYSQLPDASTATSPDEATRRTKIRQLADSLRSRIESVSSHLSMMTSDPMFSPGTRPVTPEKTAIAAQIVAALSAEIDRQLSMKRRELS
ncbi:MAG: hypothetical protein QXS20_07785 [Candidatus Thorarchaeota archaeon]